MYEKSLAIRQAQLGRDDFRTLNTLQNLAHGYIMAGQPASGKPLLREALDGRRRDSGDDHPHTLMAVMSLGTLDRRLGRLDEAEPLLREALHGYRKVDGDAHPHTAMALAALAHLHLDRGRLDEAETLSGDPAAEAALAAGYAALAADGDPSDIRDRRLLAAATDALARRFADTNRPAEAARWRAERVKYPPGPAPTPRPGG